MSLFKSLEALPPAVLFGIWVIIIILAAVLVGLAPRIYAFFLLWRLSRRISVKPPVGYGFTAQPTVGSFRAPDGTAKCGSPTCWCANPPREME